MTSTLTPKCHLEIDENTEIVFSDSSPSSWTLSKGDTEENDQQTESTNEVVNAYLNPIQDTPDETSQQITYDNIQQNWQDIYPSHFYQSYQNYETQQLLDRQLMPPPFPQLPEIKGYEGFPELISKRKRLQQKEIENTYMPIMDEQMSIITEPCKPPHSPHIEKEPETIDRQTFPHLHALFYPNFRKQYDLPQ